MNIYNAIAMYIVLYTYQTCITFAINSHRNNFIHDED